MACVIHVFHGFLGSPDDFSFLQEKGVLLHDLYEMNTFPDIQPDDTLIGYSMGGRIALELASKNRFNLRGLVLINAHPGLGSEEEKVQRQAFETTVLNKLETSNREDFMSWWNALSIFKNDLPINVTEERFKKSKSLFNQYRLSAQKDFLPELIEHQDKVLYLVGLGDDKYLELAQEKLLPHDIRVKSIDGGHRLFQKKDELKMVLVEEGVL